MSLGYGVVQLDVTIVNTALNSIGTSLGGGVSALQWVVSAYTIAFAALLLSAGALGDRIGAKRVFIAGFGIFTAASFACALAPEATSRIAARAVQGLGAAILVPNALALLNHTYKGEKERSWAVGVWAGPGRRCAQFDAPDRQRAWRRVVRLVGRTWRRLYDRHARGIGDLGDADAGRGRDDHGRGAPTALATILAAICEGEG
jgi:hypothetical protein